MVLKSAVVGVNNRVIDQVFSLYPTTHSRAHERQDRTYIWYSPLRPQDHKTAFYGGPTCVADFGVLHHETKGLLQRNNDLLLGENDQIANILFMVIGLQRSMQLLKNIIDIWESATLKMSLSTLSISL
mmetsp:Transcript_23569/g.51563  ORF Transcript_23569/g.51563 Transcript_23569/m.51563 type:complete len:128 (+) Transcript_23569:85-468(+)